MCAVQVPCKESNKCSLMVRHRILEGRRAPFTQAQTFTNNNQLRAVPISSLSLVWEVRAPTRVQVLVIVNLSSNSSRLLASAWLLVLREALLVRLDQVYPYDLAPPAARKACRAREVCLHKPTRRRDSKVPAKWALIINLAPNNCRVKASSNSTYPKLLTRVICAII